ncbi:YtxH domain-containing protein [uncultured Psychroserpens sp.]|uniref:YtxH domain-containing protein n=2 Tax=uncultured Psychroserpens sp. TaxID=255436 RepID=UPI00260C9BED|nr:YtxH domain-containing protein [uncultured Psychroserpens sp.]
MEFKSLILNSFVTKLQILRRINKTTFNHKNINRMIHKGAIVLGVLIGAAAGVLLAPEKGSTTRAKLKKEGKDIKDQIVKDFSEVKEDVSKAASSGKEKFKQKFGDFASKTSYKTEQAITFVEKQLAILKEKNKTLQKTS